MSECGGTRDTERMETRRTCARVCLYERKCERTREEDEERERESERTREKKREAENTSKYVHRE